MNDELEKLRSEVRDALGEIHSGRGDAFDAQVVRAELLRLATRNAALEAKATRDLDWNTELLATNKQAESELAAVKARIAGSAHIEVTLGCAIDGEIPPDLALCKVALVKVE